jgi:hypothetical protein
LRINRRGAPTGDIGIIACWPAAFAAKNVLLIYAVAAVLGAFAVVLARTHG